MDESISCLYLMKFTEQQLQAYQEFFQILANIKRRTVLEEKQRKAEEDEAVLDQ